MRKNFVLAAVIAVMALAISASAQKATNFGGTWNLDVTKSKLDERARIESQVMTVTQTDKDIKIETATKRTPAPEGGAERGQGRGGFGGGDVPATYTLDGKETVVEQDSQMGKIPVKFKATFEGAKLHLLQSRTFTTPNGDVTSETKGTWELSSDGKTLTINREMTSPRGTSSTTMVYTKQ
jgi:hypothetical protein